MISIIMPAFNAEEYIEIAICSVINQTYKDWELIVIDDCSTDNTFSIVERMSLGDSRIKLYRNEKNMGVALTRNRGFGLSSGDYVALLDSDDVWFEDKLSRQLQLMNSTDADIIYCSYRIIDEEGNKKCDDFIVPFETSFEDSLVKSVISCSTVLLSKKIFDKYRFVEGFYHEDLVLWLQLLSDGYIAKGVTDTLAAYRLFQGSRSSNKLKSLSNRFRVYRDYLKFPFLKSVFLMFKAALIGLRKYNPTHKP